VKHPAILELFDLIKEKDWTEFCPEKSRADKLEQWVEKWIVDVELSQSVVNPKYLTSEYNDEIKYRMAQNFSEILAEDCTTYTNQKNRITAKMTALRRKSK
jgi:hypothetical protein